MVRTSGFQPADRSSILRASANFAFIEANGLHAQYRNRNVFRSPL